MHPSTTRLARPGSRAKLAVIAALVAVAGMFALAGTSKADPVAHDVTFDHGRLTLGAVFPDNTILPAPAATTDCPTVPPYTGTDPGACGPSPLSPLVPNFPDGNAHVKVTVDGTAATVAAGDFNFPMVYVPQPGSPDTMVPIRAFAPNGLTGTWDAASGALDLTGDLRINIYTGAKGTSPADPQLEYCQIDAPNVKWSTGPNAITPGIPFTSGLDANGAISAQWDDLPNGVSVNDGDCSTVNAVIHDTGAIWLGAGESTPPPPPVCPEGTEGLWPDCQPIHVPKANITAVKIVPTRKTIKAGKKAKLTVKVTNKGDAAADVKVTVKVNRKQGVRITRQITVKAAAGKTVGKAVVLKTNRKARGKYAVTARGAGKSGRSVVNVKPIKKHKKHHKRK